MRKRKILPRVWHQGINSIQKVEIIQDADIQASKASALASFGDDSDSEDEDEDELATPELKTTLINILLRSEGIELSAKVKTFLQFGAIKNLHKEFKVNKTIENQEEYPIGIVFKKELKTRM